MPEVGIGVRSLLAKLKDDEHPVLNKKNSDELNDEEKRELKYFLPKYLTAEDWSDDRVDETLKNL